jgi:hypothetical protein
MVSKRLRILGARDERTWAPRATNSAVLTPLVAFSGPLGFTCVRSVSTTCLLVSSTEILVLLVEGTVGKGGRGGRGVDGGEESAFLIGTWSLQGAHLVQHSTPGCCIKHSVEVEDNGVGGGGAAGASRE